MRKIASGLYTFTVCWLLASSMPGIANSAALDEAIRCADEASSQYSPKPHSGDCVPPVLTLPFTRLQIGFPYPARGSCRLPFMGASAYI